jgi:hypothetical protein
LIGPDGTVYAISNATLFAVGGPSLTSASFINTNTTTEGKWIGSYGTQGYDLIGGPASLPSYASVTPSGQTSFTWSSNTTDPRALALPNSTGGIAAAWTSPTSFTVHFNLTDDLTHDLALYFLDWGTTTRVEQVTISNATTGTMLDTETVSSFHSGAYLQWMVSGNVVITITKTGGNNAVLSGLFLDPTASAAFLAQNTMTEGNWIGSYGTQGYDLIGGTASLPSYATVTPSGQTLFTWSSNTTDPRALAIPNGTGGIAACWTSPTSFTVDVNLTDGLTHDLALYFLDWGTTTRVEQMTITSAATGAVLDTATVSSFHSGVYLQWMVRGNVVITITRTDGNNAVLSGLFLDPTASAAFLAQNTATEGNWIGTYGTQGYDLIGGPASLPSYASVTPSGQTSLTWSSNTTDPRALAIPNGTGGIAACWTAPTSFTVDVNLTDGLTHDLALYLLDWGTTTRVEQVTITSAATGTVLDTETVSSFHSGVYLQWMVRGNVVITITKTGGNNAVLSGLFLDPAVG